MSFLSRLFNWKISKKKKEETELNQKQENQKWENPHRSYSDTEKKRPHPFEPWPFPSQGYWGEHYIVENLNDPSHSQTFTPDDIVSVSFPTPDQCLIVTENSFVANNTHIECHILTSTECWNYTTRTAGGLKYSDEDKWKWLKDSKCPRNDSGHANLYM
jgi:hypothetical protein